MANAVDRTPEGCGLAWFQDAREVEHFRKSLAASGAKGASKAPFNGQFAKVEGGEYEIHGTSAIELSYDGNKAPFARVTLGYYESPAEARLAAAVFHSADPKADLAALLAAHGYAGGRTEPKPGAAQDGTESFSYAKTDGGTEAAIRYSTASREAGGKPRRPFVGATIMGLRATRWSNTIGGFIRMMVGEPVAIGSAKGEDEYLNLAVQAAAAINEARLSKQGRARQRPLADGEEVPFIAEVLEVAKTSKTKRR